ncbi:hypothetical protein KM043_018389 [Ampulex compressa]|nr:hypothetical protein KM043_018389 [Ampulex compressa]
MMMDAKLLYFVLANTLIICKSGGAFTLQNFHSSTRGKTARSVWEDEDASKKEDYRTNPEHPFGYYVKDHHIKSDYRNENRKGEKPILRNMINKGENFDDNVKAIKLQADRKPDYNYRYEYNYYNDYDNHYPKDHYDHHHDHGYNHDYDHYHNYQRDVKNYKIHGDKGEKKNYDYSKDDDRNTIEYNYHHTSDNHYPVYYRNSYHYNHDGGCDNIKDKCFHHYSGLEPKSSSHSAENQEKDEQADKNSYVYSYNYEFSHDK